MNIKSKRKIYKEAVMTVEAALVLPVFIIMCYAFLYFFDVIRIQQSLNDAATRACESIASFGYIERYIERNQVEGAVAEEEEQKTSSNLQELNLNGLSLKEDFEEIDIKELLLKASNNLLIKQLIKSYIKNLNSFRSISGGFDGISFLGSDVYDDKQFVSIYMTYHLKCPVFTNLLPELPVVQCVKMRSFSGQYIAKKRNNEEGKEEDFEYVYITENGRVYHTYRDCTYIDIKLSQVSYSHINNLRNNSGAKYHACEICAQGKQDNISNVYITTSGNRFHLTASCSSISRMVTKIPISEIGDRALCSKCALRGGGGN